MNRLKSNLFFLLILLTAQSLTGQYHQNELSLEDIYKNNRYSTRTYQSVRWMEDHQHYTTLEVNRGRRCMEIIRFSVRTGDRKVLVAAENLVPGNATDPIMVRDYQRNIQWRNNTADLRWEYPVCEWNLCLGYHDGLSHARTLYL